MSIFVSVISTLVGFAAVFVVYIAFVAHEFVSQGVWGWQRAWVYFPMWLRRRRSCSSQPWRLPWHSTKLLTSRVREGVVFVFHRGMAAASEGRPTPAWQRPQGRLIQQGTVVQSSLRDLSQSSCTPGDESPG